MNVSVLSGILSDLGRIVSGIINLPITIIMGGGLSIVQLLGSFIYLLLMGLATIVNVFELIFKKLAGIDTDYVGAVTNPDGSFINNGTFNDFISQLIFSDQIKGLFIAILIFSVVLLFVFTMIAIVRSEFTLDVKGSAKGPIIGRALRSLAMFVIVPVASYMCIIGVNVLTQAINRMMQGGNTDLGSFILDVAARDGSKIRGSEDFALYINGDKSYGVTNYWSGRTDIINNDGGAFHVDRGSNDNWREELADLVDAKFASKDPSNGTKWLTLAFLDKSALQVELDTLLIQPGPGKGGFGFSWWNIGMVSYYYSFFGMNFLLGFISCFFMLMIMYKISEQLVKRMIEIVILFVLAPPMYAIAPLDNNNASKKWNQEFIKRVIMIIGPVFAINMYFILVPALMHLDILGTVSMGANTGTTLETLRDVGHVGGGASPGTGLMSASLAAAVLKLLFFIGGLQVVESSGVLLAAILGFEDGMKEAVAGLKKNMQPENMMQMGATVGMGAYNTASAMKQGGKILDKQHLLKGMQGDTGQLSDEKAKSLEKEHGISLTDKDGKAKKGLSMSNVIDKKQSIMTKDKEGKMTTREETDDEFRMRKDKMLDNAVKNDDRGMLEKMGDRGSMLAKTKGGALTEFEDDPNAGKLGMESKAFVNTRDSGISLSGAAKGKGVLPGIVQQFAPSTKGVFGAIAGIEGTRKANKYGESKEQKDERDRQLTMRRASENQRSQDYAAANNGAVNAGVTQEERQKYNQLVLDSNNQVISGAVGNSGKAADMVIGKGVNLDNMNDKAAMQKAMTEAKIPKQHQEMVENLVVSKLTAEASQSAIDGGSTIEGTNRVMKSVNDRAKKDAAKNLNTENSNSDGGGGGEGGGGGNVGTVTMADGTRVNIENFDDLQANLNTLLNSITEQLMNKLRPLLQRMVDELKRIALSGGKKGYSGGEQTSTLKQILDELRKQRDNASSQDAAAIEQMMTMMQAYADMVKNSGK